MKKTPFTLTPYQVQWIMLVGFATVGFALYIRYFAIEFSPVALACDGGLQTWLCQTRRTITNLFRADILGYRNVQVFGIASLIIAALHLIRPSIILLTAGVVAAGLGIVFYNLALSGIAIGLLILGFARPAPAT